LFIAKLDLQKRLLIESRPLLATRASAEDDRELSRAQ